jgi:hypothetical protein
MRVEQLATRADQADHIVDLVAGSWSVSVTIPWQKLSP